jgi:hypothetical protein
LRLQKKKKAGREKEGGRVLSRGSDSRRADCRRMNSRGRISPLVTGAAK